MLKINNVAGFERIKLINSKRQPPNLQKLLTKVEFSNGEVRVRKCQDLRCECCEFLLLPRSHTFENVSKTFTLKNPMPWNSFNVIYAVICSGCLEEYIGETGVCKTRVRDKTTRASKIKSWGTYTNLCRRWSNDANLRRAYKTKFQRNYKTKLNKLWQIKCMTQKFSVLLITFKITPTRDHHFLVRCYIVTLRKCPYLTPLKTTSISSFSIVWTSLKLIIKCDITF